MDRVSQALLGHLHGVFARDPQPALALRVRHANGCAWTVQGDLLTVQTGGDRWQWELRDFRLNALADALTGAGFEVVYLNPAVSHLSALTLLEGTGDQGDDNGDHLSIYTAPLTVLLAAIGQALAEGKAAIAIALAQMILPQSQAEWADLFGEIFGIPRQGTVSASPYLDLAKLLSRYNPVGATGHEQTLYSAWEVFFGNALGVTSRPGESPQHYHDRLVYETQQRAYQNTAPEEADAAYTARIIAEVQRSRSNAAAMLRNIQRVTGHDLTLREPWKEVFFLSQSTLSGADHVQGAPIYEYHRIQLESRQGIDWAPVVREAEADRPAGTLMLPPATHPWPFVVDEVLGQWDLRPWRTDVKSELTLMMPLARLSVNLNLSDVEGRALHRFGIANVLEITTDGLRGGDMGAPVWEGGWDTRIWIGGGRPMEMSPPTTHTSPLLEFATADGVLFQTADGVYFGVTE